MRPTFSIRTKRIVGGHNRFVQMKTGSWFASRRIALPWWSFVVKHWSDPNSVKGEREVYGIDEWKSRIQNWTMNRQDRSAWVIVCRWETTDWLRFTLDLDLRRAHCKPYWERVETLLNIVTIFNLNSYRRDSLVSDLKNHFVIESKQIKMPLATP